MQHTLDSLLAGLATRAVAAFVAQQHAASTAVEAALVLTVAVLPELAAAADMFAPVLWLVKPDTAAPLVAGWDMAMALPRCLVRHCAKTQALAEPVPPIGCSGRTQLQDRWMDLGSWHPYHLIAAVAHTALEVETHLLASCWPSAPAGVGNARWTAIPACQEAGAHTAAVVAVAGSVVGIAPELSYSPVAVHLRSSCLTMRQSWDMAHLLAVALVHCIRRWCAVRMPLIGDPPACDRSSARLSIA
jgi:hypothetical protein